MRSSVIRASIYNSVTRPSAFNGATRISAGVVSRSPLVSCTASSMSSSRQTKSASDRLHLVSRHMSSNSLSEKPPSVSKLGDDKPVPVPVSELGDDKPVRLFGSGSLRTIVLNREKALNALNQEMVDLINQAIDECTKTSNCHIIMLRGAGRALCSGGDVLAVVNAANSTDPEVRAEALTFFKTEFELDYKIARLAEAATVDAAGEKARHIRALMENKGQGNAQSSKIFISVMDGITMGGGVGLSVHAPLRIATERTLFAMPETGIGYFPDVGVTRVLARLDGKIGQYLGMTGARISGLEAYLIGIATHYVPSSSIEAVAHRLSTLSAQAATKASLVSEAISEYSDPFGKENAEILAKSPFFGDRRIALDYTFGQLSCESIFACLKEIASGDSNSQAARELATLGLASITPQVQEWAAATLKDLETKSPRALKVTHQAVIEARRFDIEEAFRFDIRLATAFCDFSIGKDFYTGVTHVLEKDPNTGKRKTGVAQWDPPSLSKVEDTVTRTLFFGKVQDAQGAGLTMTVPTLDSIPPAPSTSSLQMARDAILRGTGSLKWEQNHNVFALPSEAECQALREGNHPAAGSVTPEDAEIVDIFKRVKGARVGLEFKVNEWNERRSRRQAA